MPSNAKLLEIIHLQTEIAKLGIDLSQVMALVVDRTIPLVRADGAAIELAEGEDMVYRAVSGNAKPFLGLRIKRNGSLSGLCVQTGEVLLCEDSETDPRVDRQPTRKIGLRSMIVMPLRYRDATVGVLKVMSAEAHKFQKEDEMILGLLSEVVAAAMFHATRLESDDLLHKATHDALTDLANRSLFMDRLRNILSSSSNQAGLLMIDMDGLKTINDSLGHRADELSCLLSENSLLKDRPFPFMQASAGQAFQRILWIWRNSLKPLTVECMRPSEVIDRTPHPIP
ncbi:MAG TPA: GAF domain-containing protein [Leptospiraceae bacterium]|nr:GAF domain-containing protein [Leptospiraceae bacterium]